MGKTSHLFIPLKAVQNDPALLVGNRGERKILVTRLYPESEVESADCEWSPKCLPELCPVQVMADTEVAVFNQHARQERHFHLKGTEIYTVFKGEMFIESGGKEYLMRPGDSLVINPGTVHLVKPAGAEFLCQVVTVHCNGRPDKVVV